MEKISLTEPFKYIYLNDDQDPISDGENTPPPPAVDYRATYKIRSLSPTPFVKSPVLFIQQPIPRSPGFESVLEQRDAKIFQLESDLQKSKQTNRELESQLKKLSVQIKKKDIQIMRLFNQLEVAQESSLNLRDQLNRMVSQLQIPEPLPE